MKIKQFIKNIINPHFKDSEAFRNYLINRKGVKIGKGTYFFDPKNTHIDEDNGIFISIGDYCKITTGVYILAHDFSYSVFRRVYNDIPKKSAKTIIGNNCFIGINSIILMGSEIGDNVVIGAGSVVSGKIPSNQVWGGNPAKFICTLDDYYKKCCNKFEMNANLFIDEYLINYNRYPTIQELQYYSLLFLNKDKNYNNFHEYELMRFSGDEKNEVVDMCLKYNSKYNSYDEFLKKRNDKK